ncbi:MAG: ATP-binding protein [Byssovorax sp.]
MATDEAPDIHRRSEVEILSALLDRLDKDERGLGIASISGPGGIGKSYLLEHVLGARDLGARGVLALTADAQSPQDRGDFFALIEGRLAPASLPPPASAERDYFPATRKVAAEHRRLLDEAARELAESGAPEAMKKAALALLRGAHLLNRSLPKSRAFLDVAALNLDAEAVGQGLDGAWDRTTKLKALTAGRLLPAPVRDLLGDTLRGRIRSDLFNLVGEAWTSDLAAALELAAAPGRTRWGQSNIPGMKRLVLAIDDYEALAPMLGDFLVGSLLPRLAAAPFPTLLLISGRDALEDTHVGWSQHAKKHLRAEIKLAPFPREEALDLLARAGVPEERRDAIVEATHGFPFLLDLAIEEESSGAAGSALFLRRFFDRTTRWMSRREQEWFTKVCYLDRVDEDTLGRLFPLEDVAPIQDWFEREASIRDPAADCFRVRPLIRDKVLRYLAIRGPKRHEELVARAKGEAE